MACASLEVKLIFVVNIAIVFERLVGDNVHRAGPKFSRRAFRYKMLCRLVSAHEKAKRIPQNKSRCNAYSMSPSFGSRLDRLVGRALPIWLTSMPLCRWPRVAFAGVPQLTYDFGGLGCTKDWHDEDRVKHSHKDTIFLGVNSCRVFYGRPLK